MLRSRLSSHTSRAQLRGLPGALALIVSLVAGLGFVACNTHTTAPIPKGGSIQKAQLTNVGGQIDMDILWVIDNSGSMCQEQNTLRTNFDAFINQIKDTQLNFHIAVTTTHAPAEGSPSIAVVSQEAQIQSEPQPVPGADSSCVGDPGGAGAMDGFIPFREALAASLECLGNPNLKSEFVWTDDQVECALNPRLMKCEGDAIPKPDRNADGNFDRFDLFPKRSEYETFPKVLKSDDYRQEDGSLDVDSLKRTFSCMSSVGTRGYGFEKGLQVAVKAISPELTGLTADQEMADTGAPNHGFIRKDANFAIIFVTDENDCSHDGTLVEVGQACGADICEYMNSPDVEDSPLLKIPQLKEDFMKNLSATKGREVSEAEVLVASIHGSWGRLSGSLPTCDGTNEKPGAVCTTPLGKAQSGDRYERFIRHFANYFPSDRTKEDPLNFDDPTNREIGWLCIGDFSPALTAIGQFIAPDPTPCITDQIMACETDEDCPAHRYNPDVPGKCVDAKDEAGNRNGYKFCDSGVVLVLQRDEAEAAEVNTVEDLEYCNPDTRNGEWGPNSCVVDIARYEWESCARKKGVRIKWDQDPKLVTKRFTGYDFRITYNQTVTDEEAGTNASALITQPNASADPRAN